MSPRQTGPSPAIRDAVLSRARGACERCGDTDGPFAVHHRSPRQRGGTKRPEVNHLPNLVLVDEHCHADIESHRTRAYETGWLVHSWDDPATTPLLYRNGWLALLTAFGGVEYVTEMTA